MIHRRLIWVLLLGAWFPCCAGAQLVHLDPLPWSAPADSTSRLAMLVQVDRFQDSKFDWQVNRLLVTGILPAGEKATYFLRIPHVTFDTGRTPLFERWPWLQGPDADEDWPGEGRVASYGQLEIGVTGPLGLAGLQDMQFGVALGLPTGSDRLYPISSTSLPLRIELRKLLALTSYGGLALTGGLLAHMDSGKDYLVSDFAFHSGHHLGAALVWRGFAGGRFQLAYDYENRQGHRSQKASSELWWRWLGSSSIGFRATHEFQGTLDRPAAWIISLMVRLDSFGEAAPSTSPENF